MLHKSPRQESFFAIGDLSLPVEYHKRRKLRHIKNLIQALRVRDGDGPSRLLNEGPNPTAIFIDIEREEAIGDRS